MSSFDDIAGSVFCVNCRKPLSPTQIVCPYCGRDQTQRTPPPAVQEPIPQPAPQIPYMPPPDAELIELARQYRTEKSNASLTFWLGLLFCLWPLWIWTYIANTKMQAIRARVAARGIDPEYWVMQIYGRLPRH